MLLTLLGCANGYRAQDSVRVGVSDAEWSATQLDEIREELATLSRTYGVTFELSDDAVADVHLHNNPGLSAAFDGWHQDNSDDVQVNATHPAMSNPIKFRSVVGHEISHWLGMVHVTGAGHMMSNSASNDVPTAADLAEFHRATGR